MKGPTANANGKNIEGGRVCVGTDADLIVDGHGNVVPWLEDLRTRLTAGRTAFLVGRGWSATPAVWKQMTESGIPIMAVNDIPAGFEPAMWCTGDPPSYFNRDIWLNPRIVKFSPFEHCREFIPRLSAYGPDNQKKPVDCPNVHFFRKNLNHDHRNFLATPWLCWGSHWFGKNTPFCQENNGVKSSLLVGLRLLWHMGFDRVYLVGVDCAPHEYPYPSYIEGLNWHLERLKPVFDKVGYRVFNTNPDSHIRCFPFAAVADAEVAVAKQDAVVLPDPPTPHTEVIQKILIDSGVARPDRGLCGVEVGVFRGLNASRLLELMPTLSLVLVDRWCEPDVRYVQSRDPIAGLTAKDMDEIKSEALSRTEFAKDRREVIQCEQWSVAKRLRKEGRGFDFVFLDADHSRDGTREQIDAWWPLVKPGGLMMGHDYGGAFAGVDEAVDGWAKINKLKVEVGGAWVWWVRKPDAGDTAATPVVAPVSGVLRKYVVTLDTGNFMQPNARESQQDYARRCGAEYVVFDRSWNKIGKWCFNTKLYMDQMPGLVQPCRVIWLDGDVVVRHDCESLFDLVPEGSFGAALSIQDGLPNDLVAKVATIACKKCGAESGVEFAFDPATYFCGGVMVFDLPGFNKMWQWIRNNKSYAAELARGGIGPMYEQTMQNLAVRASGIPLTVLDQTYGRLGATAWSPGPMRDKIQHLARIGSLRDGRDEAIRAIDWKAPPADAASIVGK